jgi:pyruvate dehydrogenase E1 component beta subunit
MRPVIVHPRMDFMFYAMDSIVNEAANWRYMCGGRSSVPIVIWGIINRGGEQAAQHSQALHGLFAHVPGLKVVMPATPRDAKGLMIAAIRDPDPVVFIDDRWLYGRTGDVPADPYEVPIGKAAVRRSGNDLTIAGLSYMVTEALGAADALAREDVEAEVLDLRTAKPLDEAALLKSVRKTGRLIIADGGWTTGGLASEIAARVAERGGRWLKAPIRKVALPDCPAPASQALEDVFYRTQRDIVRAAKALM